MSSGPYFPAKERTAEYREGIFVGCRCFETAMPNRSIAKGEPDPNITFNYNMPFRGIAKMAGGMCTMEMAEGSLPQRRSAFPH